MTARVPCLAGGARSESRSTTPERDADVSLAAQSLPV
jgi:hypothetical protein